MRKILYLLLALLLLTGCKSKKSNRAEHREEQRSERKETKDSSIQVEKSQKVSTFEVQQSQLYEVTLESEKDSAGNAKELVYYRIRDGDSETIRVRNGKVTLKTIDNISKSLQQADTTLYKQSYASAQTEVRKHEIQQAEQIRKHTQSMPLSYILWLLLLVVLAYVYWRYKPFRWKI